MMGMGWCKPMHPPLCLLPHLQWIQHSSAQSLFVNTVTKHNEDSIPYDQYNRMKAKLGDKIANPHHEHNGLWVEINHVNDQIAWLKDTICEYEKKFGKAQEMLNDAQSSEYSSRLSMAQSASTLR